MNDTISPTSWRQLREFAAVDLTRSYVLSWHIESDTLVMDVDILLTSEHPFYERPRPAEKYCIRPAIIEFPFCEEISVSGLVTDDIVEVAASLGHGLIENLMRHEGGRYELSGEFGVVMVSAERPLLRLKGP